MKKFWSQRIIDAVPYVPGEQPKGRFCIKLNTNENPYPPSPNAISAMKAAVGEGLRRYCDPNSYQLTRAIASLHDVEQHQVFVGNGSDEVLAFAFQAFFDGDKPVTFADITYSFYSVYSKFFQLKTNIVPLNDDFTIPIDRYTQGDFGGVIIANPNAPTGREASGLREILAANTNCVVIVDEAYVEFGAESALPLLKEFENLLIVRTLSKSRSLAGLRVGYALGSENLIQGLMCVRDSINSYTVDTVAQAGATAAIEDVAWFDDTCKKIITVREDAVQQLKNLGFYVVPSKANFLFVTHKTCNATQLMESLREEDIYVRHFNLPRIENFLRITIGTPAEMYRLFTILKKMTSDEVS